ncbi:phage major tail tube protein [Vibrio sp. IB15]|uniref:phage major tail tube protein n=1 Tax=Vibrio sp. IB15 TaxID=2779368 RepID=UPI0018E7B2DA|nr:phage major tail tube protein [Vibrio sp. IB15]MBJ2148247.1 phage major tail tube protein [Vibrio sp. IB15]
MSNRVTLARKLVLPGDIKITNNIEDFTPPKYSKVYADVPGAFMGKKVCVGYEAAEWSVTIKGEMASVVKAALKNGDKTVIIFNENGTNQDQVFSAEHQMTGEVSVEYSSHKMREQQTLTLTGQISRHTWKENGVTLTEVDIDNGQYTIGGKKFNN